MIEPTIISVDESIVTTESGNIYIIGSAILVDPANRETAAQSAMQALRIGSADRKRPFHWTAEGADLRTAMVTAASTNSIPVAAIRACDPKDSEAARLDCLRHLFEHTQPNNPDLVLFESREKAKTNTGQNRADHQAITAARHAKLIPPTAKYQWVDKTEPLTWFADAVAGAINLSERGNRTYTDLLPTLTILR